LLVSIAQAFGVETDSFGSSTDLGRFFSDFLIDGRRLLCEDNLAVHYPQKRSGNSSALDYTIR